MTWYIPLNRTANLQQFLVELEDLQPVIGEWGGRSFMHVRSKKTYCLNDVVRIFSQLAKDQPSTTPEIKTSLDRIQALDKQGNALLEKEGFLIRALTAIRQFFGNLDYCRKCPLAFFQKQYDEGIAQLFDWGRIPSYQSESQAIEDYVVEFVSAFLKRFIAGQITRDHEPKNRRPMMEVLKEKVRGCAAIDEAELEELAFQAYIEEGVQGFQKKYGDPKPGPEGFQVLERAFKEAIKKDFPNRELRAGELEVAIQEAVQTVNDQTDLKREYPPLSIADTIIVVNGQTQSEHGEGDDLFLSSEIKKKHSFVRAEKIGKKQHFSLMTKQESSPLFAFFTEHGKWVIQQQATRGCTAAATQMLIKDHGGKVDASALRLRNLGSDETMVKDIRKAGLEPLVTKNVRDLKQVQDLVNQNGSAIISIGGELAGHVLIVDALLQDSARIRDPYHGWEITVTRSALEKRFSAGNDVIQIAPKVAGAT